MSERLIIFAKAPRPGEVKTRLIPSLGKEGAFEAYVCLLKAMASNLEGLGVVSVYYSPVDGEKELRPFFPESWKFSAQEGSDLGERLTNAFADVLREAGKVITIGSDCPYVSEHDVADGFAMLERNDLVLGPARDGGYWLIGMKKLHASLFQDVSWGSHQVLKQTLRKAEALGLRTSLLRELADIDTAADWEEYCRQERARLNEPGAKCS